MQARHLSTALLTLGVLVGVVAGVGLALGFEPARLPAALLNVAAYKLTFLAAFGLLAAGAVVARYARRTGAGPAARRRQAHPSAAPRRSSARRKLSRPRANESLKLTGAFRNWRLRRHVG